MERYQELAGRIGLDGSERIAKLFQMLADDATADLLLALPGQVPGLAEKLGRSVDEVSESIQDLFVKGLVFPSVKTDPPTYRMSRDLIQFHDATILWPGAPQAFYDLWNEWTEVEWPELAKTMAEILPRPGFRIIPVGVTVKADGQVLAFEDIEEIINNANDLAVTNCTCRLVARKCDHSLETCIQVNKAAKYALTRGTGRRLTKEEALELVRKCEEEGLIHSSFNQKSVDNVICNCCGDCCQFMPILIKYGTKVVSPSRFEARVDQDLCTACETCLERCYVSAISMDGDAAVVDAEKCLGCGLCKVTCPSEAISMIEVRDKDFVPDKFLA